MENNTIGMNSALVSGYVNGITTPRNKDERLSVLYWKTGKDGIKKDSKSVSIPKTVGLTPEELQSMVPHVIGMLESVQNKIVRELVESGKNAIGFPEISISECIKYLAESDSDGNGNSVRLTKEVINAWFMDSLNDKLMLALSDKLGVGDNPSNEQCQLIENTTNAFKSKICSLAGGTVKLDVKTAKSVKNAIMLGVGNEGIDIENDVIGSKLVARLDKMIMSVNEVNLLDVL